MEEKKIMNRKNNRKYVLYAHGGSANHGCEAIVRGTVKILDSEDIVLLSQRPEYDIKYGLDKLCKIVIDSNNNLEDASVGKLLRSLYRRITGNRIPHTKFCFSNLFSEVSDGDIALSIGGDNYCSKDYQKYSDINFLLNKQDIKTVLWGCSIEPDLLEVKKVRKDMNRYSLIIARESITYDALINAGITKNTHLVPDPAFILDTIKLDLPEGFVEGNTIGINMSPAIEHSEGHKGITIKNYQISYSASY